MSELFRRLRYLFNRRRFDQELANDLEFHREMAASQGGMPLGNAMRLREEAREAWGWTWIDRFGQDLRYAVRMLRKSPGFTLAAVLMLAFGIGVNIAAFGFFNLIYLRPLAIRNPDTLLRFQRDSPRSYASGLPYPEMSFFRGYTKTLSAVIANASAKLAAEGEEKPLTASLVTANLFGELGAGVTLGRMLDPSRDEAHGAEPVVVLSHGFWERHFGSDPAVLGKTIRLNGKLATVVGVASREFSGLTLDSPDLWAPLTQAPYLMNGSNLLTDFSVEGSGVKMWGRLQPGVTAKAAEAELRTLAAELHKQHPADIWENETLPSTPGGYASSINTGSHHGTGKKDPSEATPIISLVGALVLLILAVACGNLGSLLLARGVAREREISIRVSVGAGRGRLIRQLFTESLLLALLGSAAGMGLGYVVLRSLMAFTNAPAWLDPSPDWRVTAFGVGMGAIAAMLFGLTPALQVARQRQRSLLMRQFLIGAQVAGSCVLLIVAGLLVRALTRAVANQPGFAYQQVVAIDPSLGNHGYSPAAAQAYFDALKNRLRGVPGVESVSLASTAPFGNKKITAGAGLGGWQVEIHINHVDPEFFQTMKIPLLRGRNLAPGDTKAIVISESLARQWPTGDPLGRDFDMGDVKYTVIGIAGSARTVAIQDSDAVEAYFPAEAADLPSMVLLVKTAGPPEGLVRFVASVAKGIDPKLFPEVQMLKSSFRQKLQGAEQSALAVSVLGFVALLLACLGIMGLVAYAVSQRTKEIGIRMALGATPAHVLAIALRQLSSPVLIGVIAGVGGAAALSQVLRRVLYGVSNLDPLTYVVTIGVFSVAIGLAALFPARRALRVDPMRALRYD